jgi:hypothetical protein
MSDRQPDAYMEITTPEGKVGPAVHGCLLLEVVREDSSPGRDVVRGDRRVLLGVLKSVFPIEPL